MDRFVGRIPLKTIIYLFVAWIFLAVLNIGLKRAGFCEEVPKWFPISVFSGPTIHLSGIPYLLLFLVVLICAIRFAARLNKYQVWLIGLSLIILGNLGQGSWDSAFLKPFYESGIQYYHDAINITSWPEWLESFNAQQQTLLTHARTHPPFAVLIHRLFLNVSSNHLAFLSMAFTFISSLSIVLIWHIFRTLRVPLENRNLLALLFSVIPAVNIYSAVSLDGLILTGATLVLLGVVILSESASISRIGLLSMVLGVTITNALSYGGGSFVLVVAGIQTFREFLLSRRFKVAMSLLISVGVSLAVAITLYSTYGYNHLRGFITASALENPNGFQLLHEPFAYFTTRVECISEIALFLSFGLLAVLFHPNRLKISYFDWQKTEIGMLLAGFTALLGMFVSGAFRTGETARAALFIYPYIILALRNADAIMLKDILKIAGLQTVAMQLLGGYFW